MRLGFYKGNAYLIRDVWVREDGTETFDHVKGAKLGRCEYAVAINGMAGGKQVIWLTCEEGTEYANIDPLVTPEMAQADQVATSEGARRYQVAGTGGLNKYLADLVIINGGGLFLELGGRLMAAYPAGHWTVCRVIADE